MSKAKNGEWSPPVPCPDYGLKDGYAYGSVRKRDFESTSAFTQFEKVLIGHAERRGYVLSAYRSEHVITYRIDRLSWIDLLKVNGMTIHVGEYQKVDFFELRYSAPQQPGHFWRFSFWNRGCFPWISETAKWEILYDAGRPAKRTRKRALDDEIVRPAKRQRRTAPAALDIVRPRKRIRKRV